MDTDGDIMNNGTFMLCPVVSIELAVGTATAEAYRGHCPAVVNGLKLMELTV